jgi:hypothetical protein
MIYSTFLVIHVLSAVIWLSFFVSEPILRQFILRSKGEKGDRKLVLIYLFMGNITGTIGMMGVLISGIILTATLPYYGFFDFTANHWLVSKQIVMIVLLIMLPTMIIPRGKKLRLQIESEMNLETPYDESFYIEFKKYAKVLTISNFLVLLNLLFALSRNF